MTDKKAYKKEWNLKNREHMRIYNQKHREAKREHYSEYDKQKYLDNRSEIIQRVVQYTRKRRQQNPLIKLSDNVRSLILQTLRKNNFTKKSKTFEILGSTFEEFKTHLGAQFEDWMNWTNGPKPYDENNRTWQIDHIVPISNATNEQEIIKLNHYTNLRPYCAHKNISEGNRRNSVI